MEKKKKCHVEIFKRITGFFTPTDRWNNGKVEEGKNRTMYDIYSVEYPPIEKDGFK